MPTDIEWVHFGPDKGDDAVPPLPPDEDVRPLEEMLRTPPGETTEDDLGDY
jgi:hypothetical protein